MAIVILYWVDGYYVLPPEERESIFNYVKQDVSQKLQQARTNLEALPDLIMVFQQNKGIAGEILISQIQKSLESHYLLEGSYPVNLEQIVDAAQLPKDLKLEYKRTVGGYVLRLIGKDGEVVGEVYHET